MPSPLDAADSPWTKRYKQWYRIQGEKVETTARWRILMEQSARLQWKRKNAFQKRIMRDVARWPQKQKTRTCCRQLQQVLRQKVACRTRSTWMWTGSRRVAEPGCPILYYHEKQKRFKWGGCKHHPKRSLQPHVRAPGTQRGKSVFRCSQFWARGSKPEAKCFFNAPFPKALLCHLLFVADVPGAQVVLAASGRNACVGCSTPVHPCARMTRIVATNIVAQAPMTTL